jgi:transcriptional regulator of aromatic amino acid metabolism
MQEVFGAPKAVAASEATVLIQGESGTGKELAAGAIHYNSERKNSPFVCVNCSALSESLLESELFGHVNGAFTGAGRDRSGRFEEAHGAPFFWMKSVRSVRLFSSNCSGYCKRGKLNVLENPESERSISGSLPPPTRT